MEKELEQQLNEVYKMVQELRDSIEHENIGTVSRCGILLTKITSLKIMFCMEKKKPTTMENVIPPMTHQLSSGWHGNPKIEDITVSDTTAEMTVENFLKLLDYSNSIPSGVYEGKMWKNNYGDKWYLNWWSESEDPNKCKHNKREIVIR